MYTDWLLIRRLAHELSERFRGARVQDVGQLDDGRMAIALWSRGTTSLVCIDVFAATPVVTVEDGELPIASEAGFIRAVGAALRGKTLEGVRSRTGDRLLRFDVAGRSRFGVVDRHALVCELVPRFGNILLLKSSSNGDGKTETVVCALKEFAPSQNTVRSVQAGDPYEPPPLRPGKSSPLLSEDQIEALRSQNATGDLYVYRDSSGKLVQAHLLPLAKYAELTMERVPSLLRLLDEERRLSEGARGHDGVAKRRRALERALTDRERKLRAELAQVESKLRDCSNRETLRQEGESIYGNLHELPAQAREEAKERAAALFAKYKKAGNAAEHLRRRQAEFLASLSDVLVLRWELERAADNELDDVAQALAPPESKRNARARQPSRKRKPLQYVTVDGSRIFVGRTPLENADLTFRVARPDDLWFHVQNQPGAHVILQRDDKERPSEQDVLAAAALAALHSKAKSSPKVTVDFTQRKHVRKRPGAAPGLVFYTHPRSVHVEPGEPASARAVQA